ncbi:RNA-directed DNA polymerase, eukaryota [Tanacetum coccineum]
MGSYRTKEDDVARISTSVYITNFSETLSAKELFQACKQYGYVVDSFIPNKKSKNGKRFGFVRFINVFSEERLVNNLCTVWIDRYTLHANIARFQRPASKKEGDGGKKSSFVTAPKEHTKTSGKSGEGNSYMGVLKGDKRMETEVKNSGPSIVLGDECVMSKKISNALFGRVKEFASLANLKVALVYVNSMDIEDVAQKPGDIDENSDEEGVPDTIFEDEDLVKIRPENKEEVNDAYSECCENNNSKGNGNESISSGHFKVSEIPRTGGSMIGLLEEVVKVGQVMGYKNGGMHIKYGRDHWITRSGGSEAVGNLGGILCVWDPNSFCKSNVTLSDHFVINRGLWRLTGKKMMVIAVYAPQECKEKKSLWGYLHQEIGKWNGDVIIMGDFNEVRFKSDRFGSQFNPFGAQRFNSFISGSGLVEVTLGGSHFTWCHKSATKMSKLDRFLVSKSVLSGCPNINAIILGENIYRASIGPILLKENHYDYGPTPFRFFHHWLEMEGFTKFCGGNMVCRKNAKAQLKKELEVVDSIIDSGQGNEESEVTNVEIKKAVWECGMDKAPGHDGFTFRFFCHFWYLVERDVYEVMRVSSAAFKLGCLVFKTPFLYLDLTWVRNAIDFNLGMILLDRVRRRLSKWKMKMLSIGGRLTLVKSVLGSMPIFQCRCLKFPQWNKVLAPKTRVIKAIHGDDGNIDGIPRNGANSCWVNIINEIKVLAKKGINLMNFMRMKLENGVLTLFWDDGWCEGGRLKDRWTWSLTNSSEYTVASARSLIDSRLLPKGDMKTRWIRYVPIKVNTLAWKVMTNSLPTRFNISRRGIDIDTMSCVKCDLGVETTNHLFFTCDMAKQFSNLIARWWDVPCIDIDSYGNWRTWIDNIRLSAKNKNMLEGVFFVMWWLLWNFHNKKMFEDKVPSKAMISVEYTYPFVWISQKSQENSKNQASTDTRIRRVQSRSQESQASIKSWSTKVNKTQNIPLKPFKFHKVQE